MALLRAKSDHYIVKRQGLSNIIPNLNSNICKKYFCNLRIHKTHRSFCDRPSILIHGQKQSSAEDYKEGLTRTLSSVSETEILPLVNWSSSRPIMLHFGYLVKRFNVTFKRRFNFNKANWSRFTNTLNKEVGIIHLLIQTMTSSRN